MLISTVHAHELLMGTSQVETAPIAAENINYDNALFVYHAPFETVIGNLMMGSILLGLLIAVTAFLKNWRNGKVSFVQKWGWFYAFNLWMLLASVYVFGLTDDTGNFLGLFKLDLVDDLLHLVSAIWATFAAWHSREQSVFYFRTFGFLYLIDGIIGTTMGRSLLSLGVVVFGPSDRSMLVGLASNLPHILIGGFAMYIGFLWSRKKA